MCVKATCDLLSFCSVCLYVRIAVFVFNGNAFLPFSCCVFWLHV